MTAATAVATATTSASVTRRRPVRRRRRGSGLIELLVVIAILGLTFTVSASLIMPMLRKQRLASTASQIEAVAQRTLMESQRRNVMTFLYLAPRNADGTQDLRIYADTNGNGTPDTGADLLVETYVIPTRTSVVGQGEISLSMADYDQVETANWSSNATTASTARWLRIDFQGRTSNVTTANSQISGVATLTITTVYMVPGFVPQYGPRLNHQLRISPLWSVKAIRPIPVP